MAGIYPRGVYQVWLCDPYGRRLALIPQACLSHLAYSRLNPIQQVGQFAVNVPKRFNDLADIGYLVEIWRAPFAGIACRHEASYILEARVSNPHGRWTWTGEHINKLLRFRIINADRTSAGADKTGPADNLMKQYIREAMGTAATTLRQLTATGGIAFQVEADYSLGPVITKEAGRANLLDTVQQIQKAAAEQEPTPTWIMWEVSPIGLDLEFALEFRTWLHYRTHRGMSSAAPLILSETNCLSDIRREQDHGKSVNVVIVGGEGTGVTRTETELENRRLPSRPAWWRREAFVDAGQTSDEPTMQEKGYRKLREGMPTDRITATLRPHPQYAYGLNLDLGDLVVAEVGIPVDVRVEAVAITVDGRNERVDIKLEGDLSATSQ